MTSKRLTSRPFKRQTLAEKVANSIEESIVSGRLQGGDPLPTEPEIAEQFGVSRAVVRDATRMLAAKGLVEAQHGKGVFVTHTQTEAFGEALLLALRRMGASNWDVAQFEQLVFPEIVALAATNATEDDIVKMRKAGDQYLTQHAQIARQGLTGATSSELHAFHQSWSDFVQAVFNATHNKVIALLARPLTQLHGARNWEGLPVNITSQETELVATIIDLIATGDAAKARQQMQTLMELPAEAIAAMEQTEVSALTTIVLQSVENP